MRYPCRCSSKKCQARKTLARHPDDYQRKRKCALCGSGFRVDWFRFKDTSEGRGTCQCNGYPFIHRRACGVWCVDHPTGPTDDDWKARGYSAPNNTENENEIEPTGYASAGRRQSW